MNGFSFVASILQTLTWPLVTLAIVFLLRSKLEEVLDRVVEAKWGKLFVKLSGAEKLLKESSRELRPPVVKVGNITEREFFAPPNIDRRIAETEQVKPLALREIRETPHSEEALELRGDPTVEVEITWKTLTRQIVQAARKNGLTGTRGLRRSILHLIDKQLIPPQFLDAFEKIQAVRSAMQRYPGHPIDASLAKEFLDACRLLQLHLAQIP